MTKIVFGFLQLYLSFARRVCQEVHEHSHVIRTENRQEGGGRKVRGMYCECVVASVPHSTHTTTRTRRGSELKCHCLETSVVSLLRKWHHACADSNFASAAWAAALQSNPTHISLRDNAPSTLSILYPLSSLSSTHHRLVSRIFSFFVLQFLPIRRPARQSQTNPDKPCLQRDMCHPHASKEWSCFLLSGRSSVHRPWTRGGASVNVHLPRLVPRTLSN